MGLLTFLGLKKKPVEAPKKAPEPKRVRVSVHMPDGRTIVHYALSREIHANGRLSIYANPETDPDRKILAEYAPGMWESVTAGRRKVMKGYVQ